MLSKWAFAFKLTATFVHPNGNIWQSYPCKSCDRNCALTQVPRKNSSFPHVCHFQLLQNEHPFPQNEENGYPTLIKSLSHHCCLLFLLPALFVWNHRKGTVLSRWIGVHQRFQLHNGLSTGEPLGRSSDHLLVLDPSPLTCCRTLRKELLKNISWPVSTEIPLSKSSFSVVYFVVDIRSTKNKSKAPKKHTDTGSLLRRCSAWNFPKLQLGVHFPRFFAPGIHLPLRKKGPNRILFMKCWFTCRRSAQVVRLICRGSERMFQWRDPYDGLLLIIQKKLGRIPYPIYPKEPGALFSLLTLQQSNLDKSLQHPLPWSDAVGLYKKPSFLSREF